MRLYVAMVIVVWVGEHVLMVWDCGVVRLVKVGF